MSTWQHVQNQSGSADLVLLQEDAITYSVLISILQNPCTDIYSNHKSAILCYSYPPFPVWVWCKDPACGEDVAAIADCLKTAFPLDKGHSYMLSYALLDRLRETDPYYQQAQHKMGLLSHRLDRLNPLQKPCGGFMAPADEKDFDYLVSLWHDMAWEMEGHDLDNAQCANRITEHLAHGTLFTWRNEAGELTALTARDDMDGYSKISAVYTLPAYRRNGYAINLVHRVVQGILADKLTPILYTNADYAASNACYQKIGFHEIGSLCHVYKP